MKVDIKYTPGEYVYVLDVDDFKIYKASIVYAKVNADSIEYKCEASCFCNTYEEKYVFVSKKEALQYVCDNIEYFLEVQE